MPTDIGCQKSVHQMKDKEPSHRRVERDVEVLASRWYEELGRLNSYKDRDCHWLIETEWSYGAPPGYVVVHQGDIYGRIEEEYDTRRGALIELRRHLAAAVEKVAAMKVDRIPWGE
jgi:hypothetical protein